MRKKIGDRRGVAESFNNLAALCVERDMYPQAITLFEESLERMQTALNIAEQLGSRALFGIGKHSLAKVYTQFCDQEPSTINQAHAQFQEAADVLEDVGSDAQLARCLSNFGDFLLKQGERERASVKLNCARAIFKRLEMNRQHDAVSAQLP